MISRLTPFSRLCMIFFAALLLVGYLDPARADACPSTIEAIKNKVSTFQILTLKADYAEFVLTNRDAVSGKLSCDLFMVERGVAIDIQNAIVIKMMAVIASHYQGTFTWGSTRTGKTVTLHTYPEEREATKQFLLKEFFRDYSLFSVDER
jgi:hypothetical protein